LGDLLPVLPVQGTDPALALCLLQRQSGYLAPALVDEQAITIGISLEDAHRGEAGKSPKAPLGLLQADVLLLQSLFELPAISLPKLLALKLDLLALLEKVDESSNFRSQDKRFQGLGEVIHGPQFIRLLRRKSVIIVGGQKDDWCVARIALLADQLRRLEPVEAVHLYVEKHNDKFIVLQAN
jgi:hypothetical protein